METCLCRIVWCNMHVLNEWLTKNPLEFPELPSCSWQHVNKHASITLVVVEKTIKRCKNPLTISYGLIPALECTHDHK